MKLNVVELIMEICNCLLAGCCGNSFHLDPKRLGIPVVIINNQPGPDKNSVIETQNNCGFCFSWFLLPSFSVLLSSMLTRLFRQKGKSLVIATNVCIQMWSQLDLITALLSSRGLKVLPGCNGRFVFSRNLNLRCNSVPCHHVRKIGYWSHYLIMLSLLSQDQLSLSTHQYFTIKIQRYHTVSCQCI